MLNLEVREDINSVLAYMFDSEEDDFFEHLASEEYIIEEGILTEEEVENGLEDSKRRHTIMKKAAKNTKINHIYASAFRLNEFFIKEYK